MHSVNVGIRSDDHLVVAQIVDTFLYIQSRLKKIEFLVFVDHLFCLAVSILRLTAQREHGLCLHIADLGYRTGCRITLGDKDRGLQFFLIIPFDIAQMHSAIEQFLVMQTDLFRLLPGFLGYAGHSLALTLVGLDLFQNHVGNREIAAKIIVKLFLYEIADEFRHRRPIRTHVPRSELRLGLRFKDRFLNLDRDRGHNTVAYIRILKARLVEIVLDRARHSLLKGCQVGSALRRVLTVDKRIVFLAILVGMRQSHFYILTFQMDNRIERFLCHIFAQKVEQSATRKEFLSVEYNCQSGVQERIVLQQRHYEFIIVVIPGEQRIVGRELDKCSVRLFRISHRRFLNDISTAILHALHLAIANRPDQEVVRQGIDSLDADTIQSHGFLERLAVVFTAGVHPRRGLDELAERYAATGVLDSHGCFRHIDTQRFAKPHHIFVNGIVEHLLQQHVYAVVGSRPIAKLTDIHTGAAADMLIPVKGNNIVFVIVGICVRHGLPHYVQFFYFAHTNFVLRLQIYKIFKAKSSPCAKSSPV